MFLLQPFLDFLYDQKYPSSVEVVYLVVILGGAVLMGIGDIKFDIVAYITCFICNLSTAAYLVCVKWHRDQTGETANAVLWQTSIFTVFLVTILGTFTGDIDNFLSSNEWSSYSFILANLYYKYK